MATSSNHLYSIPASQIDYELVRQFVLDAEAANLFTESLTFEAKERRDRNNVAEAVAALSNTDGGIVLVGIKDKGATGVERIVGVPKSEHDTLTRHLHDLIPGAMPEVIPIAIPATDRLVIVLRVDAERVLHPVMVAGKVLFRIPGHTAPADRQRVIDLIARDQTGQSDTGPMQIRQPSWQPRELPLWPDERGPAASVVCGTLRVVGGLSLPSRMLDRPWLHSQAKQATVDVLNNSPLRKSSEWSLQPWLLAEARSGSLHYTAGAVPNRTIHAEGGAYLRLSGRGLALLVGFRLSTAAEY